MEIEKFMFETDSRYFQDKKYVLCNTCALARNGLSYEYGAYIDVLTTKKNMDGLQFHFASFTYEKNIDYEHYVKETLPNRNLLLPTKERAIVEAIIHIDRCPEGILIEAIKMYLEDNDDLSKLYEVSDFFKLSRDTLEYWLEEARNETEE